MFGFWWLRIATLGAGASSVAIALAGAQTNAGAPASQPATSTAAARPGLCFADVSYADFTRRYRKIPPGPPHETAPVELIITSIDGDGSVLTPQMAGRMGKCYAVTYSGVEVSTASTVSKFFKDSLSDEVSGPEPLPPGSFQQLHQLLDLLPADDGRVPPPGHKLVVQTILGKAVTVRVYDRARLPEPVQKLIRLTGAHVTVLAPS